MADGPLSRRTTLLMSLGTGVSVANMYFCQPLLGEMAHTFGATDTQIGAVPALTAAGTALGMLVFVPLGDIAERRGLVVRMCLAAAVAVALVAVAPTLPLLILASFGLGLTSNIPHLILPFAAQLASERERGRVVGTVVSGLLIGILLSRTVAGTLGSLLGWRAVYVLATVLMLGLAAALARGLPPSPPVRRMTYAALVRSILALARDHASLREASFTGAALFGAFNAFWTTLVFFLATPPYHYGARAVGLFGLVAAASAAIAPRVGSLVDRRSPRIGVAFGALLTLVAFVAMGAFGRHLWALIAGVVVMDIGVQAAHVANQARIYSEFPDARSRANTVYMVSYFIGGAAGASLGGWGWVTHGWPGVCAVGCAMAALSCIAALRPARPAAVVASDA